jgi:outer membrane lipopolysaccharide assembly protein LptE/RlpB
MKRTTSRSAGAKPGPPLDEVRWGSSPAVPRTPSSAFLLMLATIALLLLTSCGYHAATSGRSSHLPASVNTIYVPAFVNKTASYNTDHLLTASVVRELEERTKYKVVLQEDADADATLFGTVLSQQTSPLTYDSQTGRASSALIVVTMGVKLVDRHDHVLYENPNYVFREQYQVSRELSSFFEEESPALDRLARDFGRELVADILEAF